jgi:hypothetical protein
MPAKLDFFKKGKGFYLKLRGLASLIHSEDLLPRTQIFQELAESFRKKKLIAVKLKMESAEYFENTPKPGSNPVVNFGNMLVNWLISPLFEEQEKHWATIPVYAENS